MGGIYGIIKYDYHIGIHTIDKKKEGRPPLFLFTSEIWQQFLWRLILYSYVTVMCVFSVLKKGDVI